MRAWVLVWAWLILGGASAALGQAARPPAGAQVGAADIFKALTQPDRPAETAALKALEASLAGSPDAQKLEAARVQLLAIVKDEAARQGDLPQTLVLSQIASRIESAMEALEAARAADQSSLAGHLRPLALPGLILVAVTLAVALAAALLATSARGRAQEDTGELRDMLAKIRRRLEALGQASLEPPAAGAIQAIEAASARLHDVVRGMEAKLLAATALPGRATPQPAASAESDAHALAEEARLDALARCLEAVAGQIARLEAAAALLEQQAVRRGALPEPFPAASAIGAPDSAMPGETAASLELLSELSHVANGQCARLDQLIDDAQAAVAALTAVATRAETKPASGHAQDDELPPQATEALRLAAAEAVQQATGAAGQLQAVAGRTMTRIESACVTMNETAARLGQASLTALDGTIDMRSETRRFAVQTAAAQAAFLGAAREAGEAVRLAADGLSRHRPQGEREGTAPGGQASHEMELLQKAIETAQMAALRLQQSASDQEQALSRANEAALELARLSQRAAPDGGAAIVHLLDRAAGD